MIKTRKLARLLEAARRDRNEGRFFADFKEGLDEGHIKPQDFSIRALFEDFVPDGREIVGSWSPRSGGGSSGVRLVEANVQTSDFSNITGQLVFSMILDAFNDPIFLADRLLRTVPTQFSGEKIPGIGRIGDEAESIAEGAPYPTAGVQEEWIETPVTTKRGMIVPVTKEAIFFDRTGILLERAREVGQWLGVNKEKRALDVATGSGGSIYSRNGGALTATYGDDSGTHNWDNLQASNALSDWTDVENAELLFDGLLDPNTGEPIIVLPNALLIPTALKHTAKRLISATEIRRGTDATANVGNATVTLSANPILNQYEILTSPYVKARTSSATTWFIGDFPGAFWYMENWPITSVEAPPNSEVEFTHDVVQRFKVSERGTVAVAEPRKVVKNTA